MARSATIIGDAEDAWGDRWDVRERRPTQHGFDVLLGWPQGLPRGRAGGGGPRVIVTSELAAYVDSVAGTRAPVILPIGTTAIKRLRRLRGLNGSADRAKWWEDRLLDLADLTIARFSARHAVSTGAVSQARQALFGTRLRPAGWWRTPEHVEVLLQDAPSAAIADELDISASAVRRLRSALRSANVLSTGVGRRRQIQRMSEGELRRARSLLLSGHSVYVTAKQIGRSPNAVRYHVASGALPKPRTARRREEQRNAMAALRRMALAARDAGEPVSDIAIKLGVTRQTVHRWIRERDDV